MRSESFFAFLCVVAIGLEEQVGLIKAYSYPYWNKINAISGSGQATLIWAQVPGGPDIYRVFWTYSGTDITFKLIVHTTDWVGFGMTSNHDSVKMHFADIIVVWLNPQDGTINFTNRHTTDDGVPYVNANQNQWTLNSYEQSNGATTVVVTRKLIVCEKNPAEWDLDVNVNGNTIIGSWGDKYKANGDIAYHGPFPNRNYMNVSLIPNFSRARISQQNLVSTNCA